MEVSFEDSNQSQARRGAYFTYAMLPAGPYFYLSRSGLIPTRIRNFAHYIL